MVRAYQKRIRLCRNLPPEALLWIESDLVPWLPWRLEQRLLRGRRYLIDLDDAHFCRYQRYPWLAHKFANLWRGAEIVCAGNRFLGAEVERCGGKAVFLPTTLAPEDYAVGSPEREWERLRLGWIGTPNSQRHLSPLLDVLRSLPAGSVELHCLGATGPWQEAFPIRLYPWSPEAERVFGRDLNVGVMPLLPDPFSEGKCGFKLLQFMASGVPVVAQDTLANRDILLGGTAGGLLATTPADWATALLALARDPARRALEGNLGRQRVFRHYAISLWGPRFVAILAGLVPPAPCNHPQNVG